MPRPRSRSRSPRARPERQHRSRHLDTDDARRRRGGERGGSARENSSREKEHGRDREAASEKKSYGRDKEDPRAIASGRSRRENERGQEKGYGRDKEEPRGSEKPGVARRGGREPASASSSSSVFTPATGANADLGAGAGAGGEPPVEKEQPNFAPTGVLAAATNTVNGVVLKYSEPGEARKPPGSQRWRLFVFKDKEIVDTVDLNGNSCWLVGRDRAVADLPVDHPSCSKQHAVVQFRYVTKVGEFGDKEGGVKPYIIDLESANGTMVGKTKVPARRYLELKEGDLIMFGLSTREYILMLEKD
ncbi:hypothetical protein Q9L58_004739 [Maublancomyces gigas]|uniref:FHA domain-containing protein n=1 Tax=Discina gigas TaxID=1032678 RepID=A0ABR3GKJ9_9PEZI